MELQKQNPASLAGRNGADKNVQLLGQNANNNNTPISLPQYQLDLILSQMSPSANQERRYIQVLSEQPLIHTKAACQKIACVNLSDLRQRTADLLTRFGLEARCSSPESPIKNGYNEITGQKLWALYRIGGYV